MNQNEQQGAAIEPYKLTEIFSIIPEFDGNQIFLNTFLNACNTAYHMAVGNQKALLVLHIKNRLKGRAAELINSRNPETLTSIKQLLETHFGDARDLTSLLQDLQRIRQLPGESPLTFVSRLQTHEAKMHASVQKQPDLGEEQKNAQIQLINSMILNTLLTGLEPKLGNAIRASNPLDTLTAISRIKRELQLNYFENQKFPIHNANPPLPRQNQPLRQCSFCKKPSQKAFTNCKPRFKR